MIITPESQSVAYAIPEGGAFWFFFRGIFWLKILLETIDFFRGIFWIKVAVNKIVPRSPFFAF